MLTLPGRLVCNWPCMPLQLALHATIALARGASRARQCGQRSGLRQGDAIIVRRVLTQRPDAAARNGSKLHNDKPPSFLTREEPPWALRLLELVLQYSDGAIAGIQSRPAIAKRRSEGTCVASSVEPLTNR